MGERGGRWLDVGWVAFWGALGAAWCVTAAGRIGATFDEPYFVGAGLEAWRTGTAKPLIDTGTMPLPMYVTTAPLFAWEQWRGRPFDPGREIGTMLFVARAGTLAFWLPLLAYGWFAGRQLGGPWGGRLAVALMACEPSFLAHAGLATADVAVTAGLLAFWVHFRLGRQRSWGWRVGLPGALFAVALLAKASALAFAVVGMAAIELQGRWPEVGEAGGLRPRLRTAWDVLARPPFRRDACQVLVLALVLVFVFCGSDWKPSPSFEKWAEGLPEGPGGSAMRWLAHHLCIFSNAGNALAYQIRHNFQGHSTYLAGRTWPRAVWYFFPADLSIKVTLSFLALPALLAVLAPRSLRNWACAVAAALFLFSLNCRVQTGVRFMLPLLAAAAVGVAAALAGAAGAAPAGWRRRALLAGGVAAPLWAGAASLTAWPNGLCYVNEAWGGTPGGYLLVAGSDYDWGQGVPELQDWARAHGPVDLWYFGTDPRAADAPTHPVLLHAVPDLRPEGVRGYCPNRYLAVSTAILYSSLNTGPAGSAVAAMLRSVRPAGRTTTFLLYDVEDFPGAVAGPVPAARGPGVPGGGPEG
jgi:hypothetical protein